MKHIDLFLADRIAASAAPGFARSPGDRFRVVKPTSDVTAPGPTMLDANAEHIQIGDVHGKTLGRDRPVPPPRTRCLVVTRSNLPRCFA